MEAFLVNLQTVLPVIGLDLLKPALVLPPSPQPKGGGSGFPPATVMFEIRHRTGLKAEALEQNGEFFVLAGSEALKHTGHVGTSYAALKGELLADGVLSTTENGRYVFAKPYAFRSPSAAAAVVLDRNSNGRVEWKVNGSQQSYHDWQQAESLSPARAG